MLLLSILIITTSSRFIAKQKITLQSFTPKNRTEWSRTRFRQKPAFRFILFHSASLVIFFTDIIFFPRHRFRRRQWPPNLPPPTLRFSSKLNPSRVRSHWKIGLKGVGKKAFFQHPIIWTS